MTLSWLPRNGTASPNPRERESSETVPLGCGSISEDTGSFACATGNGNTNPHAATTARNRAADGRKGAATGVGDTFGAARR